MLPVADLLHGHKFDHLIDAVLIEKRKKGGVFLLQPKRRYTTLVIVGGKLQLNESSRQSSALWF